MKDRTKSTWWRVSPLCRWMLAFASAPIIALAETIVSYETIDLPARHNAVHPPMRVNGVSADGSVVVGWFNPGIDLYSSEDEAFVWKEDALIHPLDLGLPGIVKATAEDVSADGTAIVGTLTTASGADEAYRRQNGLVTRLGFLPGASDSHATAVSADGSVIVGEHTGSPPIKAFRLEEDTLSMLDTPADTPSGANSVSADGSVVAGFLGWNWHGGSAAMADTACEWVYCYRLKQWIWIPRESVTMSSGSWVYLLR